MKQLNFKNRLPALLAGDVTYDIDILKTEDLSNSTSSRLAEVLPERSEQILGLDGAMFIDLEATNAHCRILFGVLVLVTVMLRSRLSKQGLDRHVGRRKNTLLLLHHGQIFLRASPRAVKSCTKRRIVE